jgi:OmpA family protein
MTKRKLIIFLFVVLLALGGCATVPRGPSVMALPGQGKTFEQFQADDAICRQWADQRIGLSPEETASRNTATGAAVGTVIGAGLGAAIGAASGNPGVGAAIGAGSGLLVGTAEGANAGQYYGRQAQRMYDIAYAQCMYAKGNEVPGMVTRHRPYRRIPPPPPPDLKSEPPIYSPKYPAPPPSE